MKSKKILTSLTVIISFILILGFNTTASAAKEKYEEKFEKTVALAKDGKVILGNISGDITVKTWSKAEVKIDALKISKADSLAEAKENAGEVKIEVSEEGNVLRIETKYPEKTRRKFSVSVNYELMIPSQASANMHSVSGSVSLTKIGGAAKASTISGNVTVEDVAGMLKAHSVSGNVNVMTAGSGADCDSVSGNVEIYGSTGDVALKTVSGKVVAERVKGSVEAETVSGSVKLNDITDAKKVKANALSGSVKYAGKIYSGGSYYFKSHSGDVTVTIPSGSAFDLEATTFSGSIESDFEIKVSGKIGRKSLRGTVSGGGADLDLKTFSGSVYLRKK